MTATRASDWPPRAFLEKRRGDTGAETDMTTPGGGGPEDVSEKATVRARTRFRKRSNSIMESPSLRLIRRATLSTGQLGTPRNRPH
jgi:hypothetical protein